MKETIAGLKSVGRGLVAGIAVSMNLIPAVSTQAEDTGMAQIKDSVVIISTTSPTGSGEASGCFVEMGGKPYLVTNQHVVGGAATLKIRTLNGEKINFESMDVAKEQDLVRIRFSLPAGSKFKPVALKIKQAPSIGDKVTAYGNAQGGKVITKESGSILGVGPEEIEVDAIVVHGHSGCPVVDEEGLLVGIVTHATPPTPWDWVAKNTRYEDVRRFCARITPDLKWPVNGDVFVAQSRLQADLRQFVDEFDEVMRNGQWPDSIYGYDVKRRGSKYFDPSMCRKLSDWCRGFERSVLKPELMKPGSYHTLMEEVNRQYKKLGWQLDNLGVPKTWCTTYLTECAGSPGANLEDGVARMEADVSTSQKTVEEWLSKNKTIR